MMDMSEALVLATWGSVSVFVAWLALVSIVRRRSVWRQTPLTKTMLMEKDVPEPTPEEILEAQALGLLPMRPSPTEDSR